MTDAASTAEAQEVFKEVEWKGRTVLDLGCVTGLLCHEIAKRGTRRVVGVDLSSEADVCIVSVC